MRITRYDSVGHDATSCNASRAAMGTWPHLSQSQEEFDRRTSSTTAELVFRAVQLAQGLVGVASHLAFFALVRRHRRLQTRNFYLLGLLTVSDLLFDFYILSNSIIASVTESPIPGGRPACQAYGAWTLFALVLSVITYAIIAFERYKALVTPLQTLSDRQILTLWYGAAGCGVVVALLPLLGNGGFIVALLRAKFR